MPHRHRFESFIFVVAILFVFDVILILTAGIRPISIILRVKNRELKVLAASLSAFAITHWINGLNMITVFGSHELVKKEEYGKHV